MKEQGLINVRCVHARAGRGAIDELKYDRAFLVKILEEIADRGAALREIYDSLNPGVVFSVTEVLPHPHYQRRSKVLLLTELAGFRVNEIYGGSSLTQ